MEPNTGGILAFITALLAGGAAWGASRQAIKNVEEDVKEIKEELASHIEDDTAIQHETIDRLARIETNLEILVKASK